MCEFCTKHGEGKKWYLNARNYSYDLLSDSRRMAFAREHFSWVDKTYKKHFAFLKSLSSNLPVLRPALKAIMKRVFINEYWGQVLPIEDVESVLMLTNSITRVPCACRMSTTGKEHRVCFLVSVNPDEIGMAEIVDQSFFGGPDLARFEKVSKEWAINFFRESEAKGMLHTIWSLKAPFIGALCNCDLKTGCIPMRMYKEVVPLTFRAEYIARVDNDKCTGCGSCRSICPFSAVRQDKGSGKAEIDIKECYGCGICRAVCEKDAIRLVSRQSVPGASNLW